MPLDGREIDSDKSDAHSDVDHDPFVENPVKHVHEARGPDTLLHDDRSPLSVRTDRWRRAVSNAVACKNRASLAEVRGRGWPPRSRSAHGVKAKGRTNDGFSPYLVRPFVG